MPLRSFRLLLIACLTGLAALSQEYQSAFEPLAIGKGSGLTYKNPQVAIENGTGYVNFNMPLGPGLGVRGLSFSPAMRMHVSPKVIPQSIGEWNPADHLDPAPNMSACSLPGGYNALIRAQSRLVRYWSSGGPQYPPPEFQPYVTVASNIIFDYLQFYQLHPGQSTVSSLDPGFAHWSRRSKSSQIILPTGETIAVATQYSNRNIAPSNYADMLNDFRYSLSEVSSLGACLGSDGWLVFFLKPDLSASFS